MNHKNTNVKEQILLLIQRIHSSNPEAIMASPDVSSKVAELLQDSQGSIRHLAMSTLVMLHATLGQMLMVRFYLPYHHYMCLMDPNQLCCIG